MNAYTPTAEQDEALGAFASGCSLAIEAGAGTGKTATLELLARSTQRTGAYVAFNRSIVNEAGERMPLNVSSSTAHSVAFRQTGRTYAHRLESGRVKSWELARMLDLRGGVTVRVGGATKVLQGPFLASLAMRGVRNFCMTADAEPCGDHVPYQEGLDDHDSDGRRGWSNNRELRRYLEPYVRRAWEDIARVDGSLPFSHDCYLKLWQLGDPVIPGEFVLFDEAQDASPVMLDAVARQAKRGAQVVLVGDTQQQIYEWRGAVNALASYAVEARTFLSRSWRFGDAIADVANLVLDVLGAELRLLGNPALASRVDRCMTPDAILCRTNAASVDTVLKLQKDGRRPHLIGGGDEVLRFAHAAAALEAGKPTTHPDLACFDTWGEVQAYVESDPQGDDLKLMVHLIDEYGIEIIVAALDGMPAERNADVVVSTAHKAKGRQWPSVRLAGDFPHPDSPWGISDPEYRLMYVAATRAQTVLDIGPCQALAELWSKHEDDAA